MSCLRLQQSQGLGTFSIKTLYLPESSLYRPLLDMCHKVEENALKSYNNMSYNCGLDLDLFVPMFQMYELLGYGAVLRRNRRSFTRFGGLLETKFYRRY